MLLFVTFSRNAPPQKAEAVRNAPPQKAEAAVPAQRYPDHSSIYKSMHSLRNKCGLPRLGESVTDEKRSVHAFSNTYIYIDFYKETDT